MTLPNERECVLGLMLYEHATQRPHEVMAVFDDGGMWTWAQAREAVR